MMTDYVGGPEDNVFNITHGDGDSTVYGGGGFDILNADYSGYSGNFTSVTLGPSQIRFETRLAYTTLFSDIEQINIKHSAGPVIVGTILLHADIDGSGSAYASFDLSSETLGRIFTFDRDGANRIGNVTFHNVASTNVRGGTGNDVFSGGPSGNIDGRFWGGDGDDILSGATYLYGEDGNDVLYGPLGPAVLDGGAGDDIIHVNLTGIGSKQITGGEGNDIIILNGVTSDYLTLHLPGDAGIDELRVDAPSYALTSHFEILTGISATGQTLRGSLIDNVIRGGIGDDSLYGLAGTDVIEGGLGDDRLDGGDGYDIVSYEHATAGVVVSLAAGTASQGAGSDLLTGFEAIRGSAFDDVLGGSDNADQIDGGTGHDMISGGGGDDIIAGGAGDDMIDGGAGVDTVNYQHAAAAVTVTLTDGGGWTDTASAGRDYLVGIDNIRGTAFNDVLTGDSGVNILSGLAGADVMAGRGGNDDYWVEDKDDIVTEAAGEGRDAIFSKIDYRLPANVEWLALLGRANIDAYGNDLDNQLVGNSGNNRLVGGGGDDLMMGLAGDDIYHVDSGGDQIVEEADGGSDLVIASASYSLAANVEDARLIGRRNRDLIGNDAANMLTGNVGDNMLNGGSGDDVIEGGLGDDQVFGGDGFDTASYQNAAAAVTVSLTNGGGWTDTGAAGRDYLVGVENLRGSAFDDVLIGDGNANILSGLGGADRMEGRGGDDQYWVDNRADSVVEAAGGGYDIVLSKVDFTLPDHVEALTLLGRGNIDARGNALDNVLIGNSGNNRLVGGAGNDVMVGGAGDDTYYVDSAGDQIIEDYLVGTDTVIASISVTLSDKLEHARLIGRADLNLTGNADQNFLTGNAGDNILNGGRGGYDVLTGGAGRDAFAFGFDPFTNLSEADHINDFTVGEDYFLLDRRVFEALAAGPLNPKAFVVGTAAQDADDRIIYDSATLEIYYDADGTGADYQAIWSVRVSSEVPLSAADFLIV